MNKNNEETTTGTTTGSRKKEPQIGGINQQRPQNQYTTIGGGQRLPDQSINTGTQERRDTQEPERSGTETPKRQGTQEPERSGTETPKRERHTIYLPPDLSEWIKIRAVKAKREISEIATEAIERYKNDIENT